MDITDVRVRKVNDDGKMKAVVSITFDEEFVVHDIKVIEGQNGLFIAMPSRKMGEGDFRDIAHPLNSDTRNRIREAIFKEYEKILENAAATNEETAEEPSVTEE
jgi:stage V sporulation protein G